MVAAVVLLLLVAFATVGLFHRPKGPLLEAVLVAEVASCFDDAADHPPNKLHGSLMTMQSRPTSQTDQVNDAVDDADDDGEPAPAGHVSNMDAS